jgi:hypothetical protein
VTIVAAANAIDEASATVVAQLFAAVWLALQRAAARKERGASPLKRAAPRAEAVTNPVDRTACPACLWQEFRGIVAFIGRQILSFESAALPTMMSTPE